jgi:hypothetical protein
MESKRMRAVQKTDATIVPVCNGRFLGIVVSSGAMFLRRTATTARRHETIFIFVPLLVPRQH